jgi:isoquinoline 1-oxidoreductase beta subunit
LKNWILAGIKFVYNQSPIDDIYNNLASTADGLPFHPESDSSIKQFMQWMTRKTMRETGLMFTGGSSSVKDLWLPIKRLVPLQDKCSS